MVKAGYCLLIDLRDDVGCTNGMVAKAQPRTAKLHKQQMLIAL